MATSTVKLKLKPMRIRVQGEALVWLTAMGLSFALAMVVGLLSLIVVKGVGVFWPRDIERFELRDGGVVIGRAIDDRPRAGGGGGTETLVFIGNKTSGSQAFTWVDDRAVVARTSPADLMALERTENGDALGVPVKLLVKDAPAIPSDDPSFEPVLHRLIAEVGARREEIRVIDKERIGDNSREIRRRELALKDPSLDEAARDALRAEIAGLRTTYESLAKESRALKARQNEHRLVLATGSGDGALERSIPLGQVIDAWFPNRMGTGEKLVRSVGNAAHFVWANPREANTEGGIFPAIVGTFVMTLLMSLAVTPVGVVAAIYLREYAKQGPLVRGVRIAINNLAGVPSIVFGVFGLGFFVYIVGSGIDGLLFPERLPTPTFGTGGLLWCSLTLAMMTIPVVIVATEESIAAVPRGAREGSLAMGASKWQTIQRIIMPAAVPGILTGLILAMARGAGEVAPLMLVGVVKLAPTLPVDGRWNDTDLMPYVHLDQKIMHLGFHIYDLGFQSPDSDAAKPMVFATTLLLIMLVVALNLGAILLRERLRRRFATSAF